MLSSIVRSQPHECFRCAIRPSDPVRHLTSLRKRRERLDLLSCSTGTSLSWDGDVVDPQGVEFGLDFRLAIATIGCRRFGDLAEELWIRLMAGTEHRGVARVAHLHFVVDDDAVEVVGDLCLVAELHRSPKSTLGDRTGIGVVEGDDPGGPSGTSPARRVRVWATICAKSDRALELGDQRSGLARRRVAGPAKCLAGHFWPRPGHL